MRRQIIVLWEMMIINFAANSFIFAIFFFLSFHLKPKKNSMFQTKKISSIFCSTFLWRFELWLAFTFVNWFWNIVFEAPSGGGGSLKFFGKFGNKGTSDCYKILQWVPFFVLSCIFQNLLIYSPSPFLLSIFQTCAITCSYSCALT